MKTWTLLVFPLLFCYNANAQTEFEMVGGVNIGKIYSKINGEKQDGIKPAVGYIAAVHVGFALSKIFIFQTGLEFESVHRKMESASTTVSSVTGEVTEANYSNKLYLNYINIPLKLYFKNPNTTYGLRIAVGPFIGFGVGGRYKSNDKFQNTLNGTTVSQGYSLNEKMKFGKDGQFKSINIGLGINVVYVFPGCLSIGMYSDTGFMNINNGDAAKTKTYTAGLTVGYLFRGKNKMKSK